MLRQPVSVFQQRIYQLAFSAGLLVLGFSVVKAAVRGHSANLQMAVVSFIALFVALKLKNRYWVFFPLFTMAHLSLPGLRFNEAELGALSVVLIHATRVVVKKDKIALFNRDILFSFPLYCWILFVFCLNPTGLAVLGSRTIGARFYFQVALSFFLMTALSTIRFDEKDGWVLYFVLLGSVVFSTVRSLWFFGGNQNSFIPVGTLFTLFFARWPLSQILSSAWRFVMVSVVAIAVIYSGKRRLFGALALVPVFRVFLTGREKLLTSVALVSALICLILLAIGDGAGYRLPSSMTRSLALLEPEKYATEVDGGLNDYFRTQVWAHARDVIRENPWLGLKGFSIDYAELEWMHFGGGRTTDLFEGHSFSRNWHSVWYAYAADFGLPALFFFGVFYFYAVAYAFRAARRAPASGSRTCCLYYYTFELLVSLAFSYTSGHSATSILAMCGRYGMVLALSRSLAEDESRRLVA